ncbi:MAG TPA: DUF455 domain-containing protein, partial [Achromobacter sp.]|nr:DUF455 domain-containing protein [Achromobacter sp.]
MDSSKTAPGGREEDAHCMRAQALAALAATAWPDKLACV